MIVKKGFIWFITCIALLACKSSRTIESAAKKPNIVFILTDDQGWGDVALNGNDIIQTPTLTFLAKEGVQFTRFYVSSVCAPSRASFLTGRYHPQVGVTGVSQGYENMPAEEITFAEVFKEAGYRTGCFGKWHNGKNYPENPQGQGFDTFFGFCSGGIGEYFDPELETGYQTVSAKGYVTDILTDSALAFIERNQNQPFLCYIPYNAPHTPYQVSDQYFNYYSQLGCDAELASVYGMVTNIDDNIKRILDKLQSTGLADNTIVVFSSDNGPTGKPRYNGTMKGKKGGVDEGSIRVPLYLYWPGKLPKGKTIDALAAHIDLLPTLAALCNIRTDTLQLDGINLVPLINGQSGRVAERQLFTQHSNNFPVPGGIRTDDYRLTLNHADTSLYNMQTDPSQQTNIFHQKPETALALTAAYSKWIAGALPLLGKKTPVPIGYDAGKVIRLTADEAAFTAPLKFFKKFGYNSDWLTGFGKNEDRISWPLAPVSKKRYQVSVLYTCPDEHIGTVLRVSTSQHQVQQRIETAFDPQPYQTSNRLPDEGNSSTRKPWARLDCGTIEIVESDTTLMLTCNPGVEKSSVIDIREIVLTLVE